MGPWAQSGVGLCELVGTGVVDALKGPHLHAGAPRVDVACQAAANIGRVALVLSDEFASAGVVVVFMETTRAVLLHAVALQSRTAGVHLGDVETVTVDNALGTQQVAHGAVTVEHEADLADLVPAVTVHVDDAGVVSVRGVLAADRRFLPSAPSLIVTEGVS